MLIQYASDLHLEFDLNRHYIDQHPLVPTGQVLVLAGDITNLNYYRLREWEQSFLDQLADQYELVLWIPGNHEYYRSRDLADNPSSWDEFIRPNVRLLNNATVEHQGVRFVCSTLWSSIPPEKAPYVQRYLSDFHLIRYGGEPLTPQVYNQLHQQAVAFLEAELNKPFAGPTVVVTHHVPSFSCEHPRHKGSPLSAAFVSEQGALIRQTQPAYWIYGHSHGNMPLVEIGHTKLVTNQLGYLAQGEHTDFRATALIETTEIA